MKRMLLLGLLLALLCADAQAEILYIDAGNANSVHLREAPTTKSKSFGLYFSGTPVAAGESSEGFTSVSIGTENGYMKSEYLKGDTGGIDSALRVGTVKPGVSYVNLRRHAGDAKVIGTVMAGDTVTVMGETANGWYYVKHGEMTGYMKSSLVRLGGTAAMESTLREQRIFMEGGAQITAELHDIGGGEYEREYRLRLLKNGMKIFEETFTGDPYDHLGSYAGDAAAPVMHVTDVNMDGHADISVIRYAGATDAEAAHVLYDPQAGRYARHAQLDTLSWWRCELYPRTRMMLNYMRDGAAFGVWELYRWEEQTAKLLLTGVISSGGADGVLQVRVFRNNEIIHEAKWDEGGEAGSQWLRQRDAMLEVMFGGVEPGEAILLDSTPIDSSSASGAQEGSNG